MKKKFLSFIFALCLIIPCAFLLSACGKEPEKEAVSVTIEFAFNEFHYGTFTESESWEVDETTNTFTTTYMNSFAWDGYLFDVVATTENGDTRTLYEATDSNPMGYKIDTNMPEGTGRLPVGTYTFKLYCEDFNNGEYKAEACESETYTIIIEKEPIELIGGWQYSDNPHTYNGFTISVSCGLMAFNSEGSGVSLEDAGIKNFREVEGTFSSIVVGDYVARVEYEADTTNFNYIGDGLPEKEFEWSIDKTDYSYLLDQLWNDAYSTLEKQYNMGNDITLIYGAEMLNQNLQGQSIISVVGFKVSGTEEFEVNGNNNVNVTKIGTYKVTPIIAQTDTTNYVEIDLDSDEFIERYSRTFTITKMKFDASSFNWHDSTQPYNPNGPDQEVYFNVPNSMIFEFEYVTDLDNSITNKAKNAGVYTAKVELIYDENSYEIINGVPQLVYQWEIERSIIDLSNCQWTIAGYQNSITYDLSYNRPEIQYGISLPRTYKHYDSEGNEVSEGQLDCGNYKTIATLEYDTSNYYIEDASMLEYEWTVTKIDYENKYSWSCRKVGYDENYSFYNMLTLTNSAEYILKFECSLYWEEKDVVITYSVNNGEPVTMNDSIIQIDLDWTAVGTYTIRFTIDGLDSINYNPVKASLYTLTVNIIEA